MVHREYSNRNIRMISRFDAVISKRFLASRGILWEITGPLF
jgi:hypothetical protein